MPYVEIPSTATTGATPVEIFLDGGARGKGWREPAIELFFENSGTDKGDYSLDLGVNWRKLDPGGSVLLRPGAADGLISNASQKLLIRKNAAAAGETSFSGYTITSRRSLR